MTDLQNNRKKKVLITGGKGMLAHDFIRTCSDKYDIIAVDREECDITSFESVIQCISLHEPDILLNCAAYTAVDDAEDIGMKTCYEVNTLGSYNLARATSAFGVEFISISTDYVFDGKEREGYLPNDTCNPIGAYGMSKYLGEKLAQETHPNSIIVRTSWLYGGVPYNPLDKGEQKGVYKNFVNTMLKLSETRNELTVINDQFGSPTYTRDLSNALGEIIENIEDFRGNILQLSGETPPNGITWFDFANEIFKITGKEIHLIPCTSEEYKTKAQRPKFSKMNNNSSIKMRDWREGLREYLSKL